MKQLKLPLLLLCGFLSLHANAKTNKVNKGINTEVYQENPIKGRTVDENGLAIADAEIVIKGTNVVTYSDENGQFEITPSTPISHPILIIKSLDYPTTEIKVTDSNHVLIKLKKDMNELNEVVVTALGIKKSDKAIGYAAQSIKGSSITEAREWIKKSFSKRDCIEKL